MDTKSGWWGAKLVAVASILFPPASSRGGKNSTEKRGFPASRNSLMDLPFAINASTYHDALMRCK
jgi:hypothetical protein